MLDASPAHPTPKTSWGDLISVGSTKRWMASRKMDKHKARRKTPLTNAPNTSARCQPYV
jgi:hypothetical protein